jgi:subtilisin family serine protease
MYARRFALAGVAVALAACSEPVSQPSDADDAAPAVSLAQGRSGNDEVMPGQVIVGLRDMAQADAVARAHGLAVGQRGLRGDWLVMHGAAVGAERGKAAEMAADSRVRYAEPNYLRQPTAINPNLWAFYNPGGLNMRYSKGKSLGQPIGASYASVADADEDNVENYAAGGVDVVIGSIDTGVDLLHPEFSGRLIAGQDWYNNDADPTDDDGHGSHTTGTMAGSTVGIAGVSGASSHVRVYVQKVCGRRGCPTSAIVNAIYAAADYPNMVAMNLSLGGSSESSSEVAAINYAVNTKGVLLIASAGNSGAGSVSCPACDPNAISVAATNWRDEKASYSQFGPGLDIAAPGGQCYSNTTPEGCIYSAYKNGGYAWLQGTSMAAPQVTGTAAIVASKTGLRGSGLRNRLLGTTDNINAPTLAGVGRLNSYRAVTNSSLPAGQ